MFPERRKFQRGFSMVEIIVAVAIVGTSFVGILLSLNQALRFDKILTEKTTALYLAQEGIEIVRNIRDSNRLADKPWDQDIPTGVFIPILNNGEWELNSVGAGESWKLKVYFDPSSSMFLQTKNSSPPAGWQLTPYTRQIEISKGDFDGDGALDFEIKIKSKVWYEASSNPVVIESFLYNWR